MRLRTVRAAALHVSLVEVADVSAESCHVRREPLVPLQVKVARAQAGLLPRGEEPLHSHTAQCQCHALCQVLVPGPASSAPSEVETFEYEM